MADKSFDVVIVGGGNKGLITAMYLTKYAKLSVGIFEDRHELGGGWCQEEGAPGFLANVCSMHHTAQYHIPTYWDFPEWETYGAKYHYTKVGSSCQFIEDDTCLVQYTAFPDVDPTQEKTAAEIARFSEKDADTYLYYWDKLKEHWEPAFLEQIFNPAARPGEIDPVEKMMMSPDSGIEPVWVWMSPFQLYKDLYEDIHTQCWFARTSQSVGVIGDLAGAALFTLFMSLIYWSMSCWAKGSSHSLAHASQRVIFENGGKAFTNSPVEKIIIENGRARGIRLEDGSRIDAKKFVVTALDPHQLCSQLIGRENISPRILRRVENTMVDELNGVMWYNVALKERPRYKSEAWNPDVWQTMWGAVSDLDFYDIAAELSERRLGKWPSKFNLGVAYHGESDVSPGDGLIAPEEINFTMVWEQYATALRHLSEKEWEEKEKRWMDEAVETMHKYAPNITWDKVIGYHGLTPWLMARQMRNYATGNWCGVDHIPSQLGKFRPIPELARHKVPGIENLYVTGAGWHPWGGAHSAQGYNCYKVITEDWDFPKPWEVEGRPF